MFFQHVPTTLNYSANKNFQKPTVGLNVRTKVRRYKGTKGTNEPWERLIQKVRKVHILYLEVSLWDDVRKIFFLRIPSVCGVSLSKYGIKNFSTDFFFYPRSNGTFSFFIIIE